MPRTDHDPADYPGYLRADYPSVRAVPGGLVELNGFGLVPHDARELAAALLAASDVSEGPAPTVDTVRDA